MGKQYGLMCPNGNLIVKTIEMTTGTAGIDPDTIQPLDNEYGFDFDWDGMGTDFSHSDSETLTVEKVRQFFCDAYEQHGEDELRLVVMDDDSGEWVAPTKELGLV